MSIRRMLCLVLAMLLGCACALAESDTDALNARIAELEAQVELYKPYYDAQIVAEFDGGVVLKEEAMEIYDYYASMFSQYGIDLAAYGYDTQYKQTAVDQVLRQKVIDLKAAELGLDTFTEEEEAALQTEAKAEFDSYLNSFLAYYYASEAEEGKTPEYTEDQIAAATAVLTDTYGYSVESLLDTLKQTELNERVTEYVLKDVAVTEEDVQATYDALVAEDAENYADEATYVSARTSGNTIYCQPEGYRMIKQVLIKFDDDQSARYSDLNTNLNALKAELEAIENPSEEATEAPAEEAEETAAPRTAEEVQADIAAVQAELDALYAELMPEAEGVVTAFNAGTSFEDLMAAHNDDLGEPADGYPVKADSTYFDPAFANAAMAIEQVGGIGEPACGSYGIYITYYADDVTPGAIALEEVYDAVEAQSLADKQDSTYENAVLEWVAALNPVYHYSNMD